MRRWAADGASSTKPRQLGIRLQSVVRLFSYQGKAPTKMQNDAISGKKGRSQRTRLRGCGGLGSNGRGVPPTGRRTVVGSIGDLNRRPKRGGCFHTTSPSTHPRPSSRMATALAWSNGHSVSPISPVAEMFLTRQVFGGLSPTRSSAVRKTLVRAALGLVSSSIELLPRRELIRCTSGCASLR